MELAHPVGPRIPANDLLSALEGCLKRYGLLLLRPNAYCPRLFGPVCFLGLGGYYLMKGAIIDPVERLTRLKRID